MSDPERDTQQPDAQRAREPDSLDVRSAPPESAAEQVLHRFERLNASAGHENAGFLSTARGFVPLAAPACRLDRRFAAWDELAAELPALYPELRVRARVDRLPLLDAAQLRDVDLLRASALLAVLSHAYWYADLRPPTCLPEVLRAPWSIARARLGRPQEVLSYVDLIVYNWRFRNPDASDPFGLSNLDLLLPTIGNREERLFYLTQLEILARASPIVSLMAAAQSAALRMDDAALERCLAGILQGLRAVVTALAHIDPRPRSSHHVDPVRWAKTVAPFAVPIRPGDLGPSGTSSPLFNALDAFFGRTRFDSFLGREILQLRASYPPAWRAFVVALEQTSVAHRVEQSASSALRAAWRAAHEAYAGERGFLGRHRMKVYGYLEAAFKVGRTLTIGGFSGTFNERTWDRVDDALEQARVERSATSLAAAGAWGTKPDRAARVASYDLSEIARHNRADPGYWLIVDGDVYDVTRFCDRHPGGAHVLRAYAGLDASTGFARAHRQNGAVDALRAGLRIGVVRALALGACEASAHRAFASALWLVVEMQNALEADQAFRLEPDALPDTRGRYELQRALDTHLRFAQDCLSVLADQTLPELWRAAGGDADLWRRQLPELRVSDAALRVATKPREAHGRLEHWLRDPSREVQLERLAAADRRLLDELKHRLIAAVRTFERCESRSHSLDWQRLRRACLACLPVIRRYYQRADSALSEASLHG